MNATTMTPNEKVKFKLDGQYVVGKYINDYRGSAVVEHDGRRVVRAYSKIERVADTAPAIEQVVNNTSTDEVVIEVALDEQLEFDVNTRFNYIELLVDMVVRGQAHSMIVTGSGGLGKSFTVFNRLKMNDLGEADFVKISGHMTPLSLYTALYNNNGKMLIFDDCDSVLESETAANLLKAALDSYGRRTVSWCSTARSTENLPSSFDFTGRIIFISNYSLGEVPQPILSRSLYVDVTMTPAEKLERIRAISEALIPGMDEAQRTECIDLIDRLKEKIADLNFRTVKKVADIRRANPTQWRNLATYVVTADAGRR